MPHPLCFVVKNRPCAQSPRCPRLCLTCSLKPEGSSRGTPERVTGRRGPSTDGLLCPDIWGPGCHPPLPSAVISQMCIPDPGDRAEESGRRTSSPRAIVPATQDAGCPWSPLRTLQANSQVPWNLGPGQAPWEPHVSPASSSAEHLAGQDSGLSAEKNKKLMSHQARTVPATNCP